MERPAALTRARRVVVCLALVATAAACGALAGPAGAAWTRPVRISGASPVGAAWTRPVRISAPTSISLIGPQVASSLTGAAAVSFNEVNLDQQATASTFVALAPPHGTFSAARVVPGAQEVLAIAYSGSALELLTASGPPGQPCCSTVQVIRSGARRGFGHRQTLVTDVGGGTTGQLVPLGNGRMLAVIAGPQRLWAAEASAGGRFGAVKGLTPAGSAPAAVAATAMPDGGSIVSWTRGSAQSVFGASAGPGATPSRPRVLLTLAPGHAIDGLQLAPRPDGTTVGWTQSWNDSAGTYHAQAAAADLAGGGRLGRVRALSAARDVASGLALSSSAGGAEVAGWDVCAPSSGGCVVEGRVRPAVPAVPRSRRRAARKRVRAAWFGALSHLGQIDAGESPDVAMATGSGGGSGSGSGSGGKSLIGWITGGRVALAAGGAGRFGPARLVSGGLAENLELGFGPTGEAVAAWTEGTAAPGVFVVVGR